MTKEELLTRTLEDLGKGYPIGLYEYLFRRRTDLYKQLIELEDKIDHTYLNPNESIDQLKAVLREYWTFHISAIKEFTQIPLIDINIARTRDEMSEERMRA